MVGQLVVSFKLFEGKDRQHRADWRPAHIVGVTAEVSELRQPDRDEKGVVRDLYFRATIVACIRSMTGLNLERSGSKKGPIFSFRQAMAMG